MCLHVRRDGEGECGSTCAPVPSSWRRRPWARPRSRWSERGPCCWCRARPRRRWSGWRAWRLHGCYSAPRARHAPRSPWRGRRWRARRPCPSGATGACTGRGRSRPLGRGERGFRALCLWTKSRFGMVEWFI